MLLPELPSAGITGLWDYTQFRKTLKHLHHRTLCVKIKTELL
jgi:hypothetical protein